MPHDLVDLFLLQIPRFTSVPEHSVKINYLCGVTQLLNIKEEGQEHLL